MKPAGEILVQNLSEFHKWVKDFALNLQGDEIILLSGEMGAGKTEFAKTIGAAWGVQGVVSPTFALHATFETPRGIIDHFDLYRIESEDELETTNLWEILASPSLAIIEWPERVPENAWPRGRKIIRIRISKVSQDSRRIVVA